ncbi:hypothetical protein C5F59_037460 [Streptomyces sp. QL37]|uniref:hypothetical protein n=1 Tax=Streptomyces sp. QL37 TaxID=2093747 RepID=UPI0021CB5576|nr:hypothetical protein [Streptomyces sp. QL37]
MLSLVTSVGSWIAPSNRVVWIPAGFEHRHRAHGRTDMRIVFMEPSPAALLPSHPAVLVMTPLAREATLTSTGSERRSAALVEEGLAEPLTLGRLGHRVGASERTLSRLFQQETGMSSPSGAPSSAFTTHCCCSPATSP